MIDLSNSEVTATIDCTGGWYSTQIWRGVRLVICSHGSKSRGEDPHHLDGYFGLYCLLHPGEASEILLATHVGDQLLDHQHGYPLRAVVPHGEAGTG